MPLDMYLHTNYCLKRHVFAYKLLSEKAITSSNYQHINGQEQTLPQSKTKVKRKVLVEDDELHLLNVLLDYVGSIAH